MAPKVHRFAGLGPLWLAELGQCGLSYTGYCLARSASFERLAANLLSVGLIRYRAGDFYSVLFFFQASLIRHPERRNLFSCHHDFVPRLGRVYVFLFWVPDNVWSTVFPSVLQSNSENLTRLFLTSRINSVEKRSVQHYDEEIIRLGGICDYISSA